jgi:hypothetical protein
MKIRITLLALFFTFFCNAATVNFFGACLNKPILHTKIASGSSLLAVSTQILDHHHVSYQATENSIDTLFGLSSSGVYETTYQDPTLGPNDFRVYGWCYEVNGEVLSSLPSDYIVKPNDTINWFYGYASYQNGSWTGMCQKSYELVPEFLCGDLPL